ncbi:hypothetical protein PENANT_c002G00215 [Penicillium antarcticum]|uniref:Uncharacterized protein n=1 Tax=Penicillium antarcticum TaxID=416450 RepID=A0A1V6QJN2_9EURO|nr:hypothetical protein PENANT_c002G00215 [Penicillium antarcticum]
MYQTFHKGLLQYAQSTVILSLVLVLVLVLGTLPYNCIWGMRLKTIQLITTASILMIRSESPLLNARSDYLQLSPL